MANEGYLIRLQDKIGYRFKDVALLDLALTAAGAEGDKEGDKIEREKYDGNRKLAQLGDSLLQFIVLHKALYEENAERSSANNALKDAAVKENQEKRARYFEIDTHMKLSPRQKGRASVGTLSLAVCAIFGACFQDSGNISNVRTVIEHFGIGIDQELYDPITTRRQNQFSTSQLVIGLSEDDSDVASSDVTLSSLPATVDNYLWIGSGDSPQIAGVSAIDNQEIRILELGDGSIQSQWDNENSDDDSLFNVLNQEQLNDVRSDSPSASLISLRRHSINTHSTSNHSSIDLSMQEGFFQSFRNTPTGDIDGSLQDVYEGTPTLPQAQRGTSDTGYPSSSQRPAASNTGKKIEKRKRPVSNRDRSAQLDKYILLEKARCQSLGLPCPEEGFNSAINQASNKSMRLEEVMMELKVFYFAIASPESLTALQAIVKVQRRSLGGKLSVPNWKLPLAERIKEIESLSEKMGYIGFLRRCHTYQLYVDSSAGSQKTSDGFVNATTQSISTRSNPGIGNPNNLEDSRVSKLIIKEVYPNLELNSSEYQRKLRFVGRVRKLGQRLDLLVETFGYGILGLLPLAIDVAAVEPILNITDNLILKIPDETFRWFVQFLNHTQGDLLRETSKATSEVVAAIFQGTLDPSKQYGIEHLRQEVFMQHPKGSPMILKSISKAVPNTIDTAGSIQSRSKSSTIRGN